MSRFCTGFIVALALLGVTSAANATVVFSGSSDGLSATASFTITGNTLTILLTNTDSTSLPLAPDTSAEVLSGLFFNLGTSAFTPVLATVYSGSTGDFQPGSVIQTGNCTTACSGATNIGGEWSYAFGGAGWLSGTNQGIASAGYLNDNTSAGNFPGGTNYQDPVALDGIQFGLVPDGWAEGTGNGGLDGQALIEGAVQFVLTLPSAGMSEGDISNVYFTYGTAANENTVRGTTTGVPTTTGTNGNTVPEPAMLSVLGIALAGLGVRLRRRHLRSN